MSRLLRFLNFLWTRKSWLATIFFIVVVGFLDSNSFYNLFLLWQTNQRLKAEIALYERQYEEDTHSLLQLDASPQAVEKVARLNLLMKTDNEDVYVVVEE